MQWSGTGRRPATIAYTSYQELSQNPEVYKLVQKEVIKMNRDLPSAALVEGVLSTSTRIDPMTMS